jgi:hypothetical protein
MTIKEQLFQEIESTPENLLEQTLGFLRFLKTKQIPDQDKNQSTGQSLLAHLQTMGRWDGEDVEECLETVYKTRAKVKFDYSNPFDE